MNILVLLRMVPDVVEELEISPEGKSLDMDVLRFMPSEFDDHALEQALLLKEAHGGTVTVIAPDAPELDDALFTALAKGADRAVKIAGVEPGLTTRRAARLLSKMICASGFLPADLILTGTQAIDDLDGLLAPLIAYHLRLPYIAIVTRVKVDAAAKTVTALKEYPGGVHAEFEAPLPAVLAIQAAEKPPRYVPVAKVRAAMKSARIESVPAPAISDAAPLIEIGEMSKPEMTGGAEILAGSPEDVAGTVCEILAARGLL